jgi:hypothetical protein
MLETAQLPIHEPGLDQIVARNGAAGRLHFTCSRPNWPRPPGSNTTASAV